MAQTATAAAIEIPEVRLAISGAFARAVDPRDIRTPIRGLHNAPDGALLEIVLAAPGVQHIRTTMPAGDLVAEMRAAGVPVFALSEIRAHIGQVPIILRPADVMAGSLQSVYPASDPPPANHDYGSVFRLATGESVEVAEPVSEVLARAWLRDSATGRFIGPEGRGGVDGAGGNANRSGVRLRHGDRRDRSRW